jgi:hypothetical protein
MFVVLVKPIRAGPRGSIVVRNAKDVLIMAERELWARA